MAPIRRYLRITRYSVLEVRIYLDKPSDAPWLLSSRDPVLPRIMQVVKPKVLPKLREENENAKKRSGKKKRGIKDVASQDDFEVTIFLTEHSSRHSLLTKRKDFQEKPRLQSTGSKLTGWLNSNETPITVEDDGSVPTLLREEGDEVSLHDIPERAAVGDQETGALFVGSSDDETFQARRQAPSSRTRRRKKATGDALDDENPPPPDDKKKFAMSTEYDGFSIYGRILCLVVKRKVAKKSSVAGGGSTSTGSEMMEQWVSTQIAREHDLDDYNDE